MDSAKYPPMGVVHLFSCTHTHTQPLVILTIFSLSLACSPSTSSSVPVRWRPEEVAVLTVAPVGAIMLLGLMSGGRGR